MNTDRYAKYSVPISVCSILALCLFAGLPTVFPRQYFLADDFGLVQHLHRVPFQRLFSYFASDWTEGIYGMRLDELRPVLALSYRLDAALWGATNSAGYHLSNVLLHVLNALLVCAIARSVAPANRWIGLIAGSLFAIVPSHAEPLAWISGRVDPLAAVFYLGAVLCFVRFRSQPSYVYYAGSLVLFSLGLFAKQSVVTLPAVLLAYDLISTRRAHFTPILPFFAVLAFYLGLRRVLFGSALREETLQPDLLIDFIRRQVFYVSRLLPFSPGDSRWVKVALGVVSLLIFGVLIWWLLSRKNRYAHVLRRVLFFGPVWYALTISPMIVTYSSARHLYLTAAGLSIAAALLILPDPVKTSATRIGVFACLLVLYGAAISRGIRPWIDNGLYSARISSQLPAALRSIPPGSTVLVAIPALRNKVHFWDFALPFAVQPPFLTKDLYGSLTMIEPDDVYCCPPQQWWPRLQPILASLNEMRPVYVVTADPVSGHLSIGRRGIQGAALKERLEALSQPVLSLSDAGRISRILFPELETSP